jgi:hypothetical protein
VTILHHAVHNLDLLAAAATCTSTTLLACRRRAGFVALIIGSALWLAVALLSSFQSRPIVGMVASSVWTCANAAWGWWRWR